METGPAKGAVRWFVRSIENYVNERGSCESCFVARCSGKLYSIDYLKRRKGGGRRKTEKRRVPCNANNNWTRRILPFTDSRQRTYIDAPDTSYHDIDINLVLAFPKFNPKEHGLVEEKRR